jgi:hypothetical protein
LIEPLVEKGHGGQTRNAAEQLRQLEFGDDSLVVGEEYVVELTAVRFLNFKGLSDYRVTLRDMNVLVGPNNAGKSSILDAFRLLGPALRHAKRRNPVSMVEDGVAMFGWEVPPSTIPISLMNVHLDSDSDAGVETSVTFFVSDGSSMSLLLKNSSRCIFKVDVDGPRVGTAAAFRSRFPIDIFAFPTLGPLEDEEDYLTDEYVGRVTGGRLSHRIFRNVWFRQAELFPRFKATVESSWPGIMIAPPERFGFAPARLEMFFSEKRRDREVSWAGYGFQVWLQLLTHMVTSESATTLVVDEPEIYLHPDLQRRFFELLRATGKQIVLATHSAEIVNDAERDDVVLINRGRRSAKRIGDIEGLQEALFSIGSAQNIHLTKLSRGRRVLFLEGQDFRQLRRLAGRFGFDALADGGDLTVVPIGGFAQKQRIEDAAWTFGQVLKAEIMIAGLLDRDYRCDEEIAEILAGMRESVPRFHILGSKEIENYLLVPHAIGKAIETRLRARPGQLERYEALGENPALTLLMEITEAMRGDVQSQLLAHRIRYFDKARKDTATVAREAVALFDAQWSDAAHRLRLVSGKATISALNSKLEKDFGISVTAAQIISHLRISDLAEEMQVILSDLDAFARAGAQA